MASAIAAGSAWPSAAVLSSVEAGEPTANRSWPKAAALKQGASLILRRHRILVCRWDGPRVMHPSRSRRS